MAPPQDIWYVRLPDGRVIRTTNTVSLRFHVRNGRIPLQSRIRRSKEEPWHALDEVQELVDVVEAAAARTSDGNGTTAVRRRTRARFKQWRALGVRGLGSELLDALDSSLHRTKLGIAGLLAGLGGVAWITWDLLAAKRDEEWWIYAASAWAVMLVLAACLGISLVTQQTSFELARMRSPRPRELWPAALGHAVRLAVALLLIVGGGAALVVALRALPDWMVQQGSPDAPWWTYLAWATLIVRLILEVVFWPVVALAPLLLSPILVVQECSVLEGIREWWRILRQHLGRIFLYEALATTLGAVFTVPLLIPIGLAGVSLGSMQGQQLVIGQTTVTVLAGIALTPFIAYLLVANVFIYLNVRYEFLHSAR